MARYQLEIDFATIPTLAERHDLRRDSQPADRHVAAPVVRSAMSLAMLPGPWSEP